MTAAVGRVLTALARSGSEARQRCEAKWPARCSAHEDKHQSLSIGRGRGGGLVCCRAGCNTAAVLEGLGLRWADLFDALLPTRPSASPRRSGQDDEGKA